MYHHSFLIEFLKAQSIPSREATYRPAIVGPSESSSKALVADSALRQIDLPNYKELFSVSSDRATNKRKYEEIMAHDDDNLDHEIRRLQVRLFFGFRKGCLFICTYRHS